MIVSLAISETIERIDRVYFFDLMGAAGGCLLLVPFLNVFGGPNTVIVAAILFAASAAIWFNLGGATQGRALAVALALVLVGLTVVNMRRPIIDVTFAKGQRLANEIFVKWNSFSRIGLAPSVSGQAGRQDPDHRPRRRVGCCSRFGVRQQGHHRGGD
jgi:hypothetical protein